MKHIRLLRNPARFAIFRKNTQFLLIIIGVLVGVVSGVAAVLLARSLEFTLAFLHDYRHMWWAFLLPGAGAMLSSLFLEKVMNEGAGHGVPEVIYSVFRRGGLLRFRSCYSRLISSWLTIGSGGSAGPEAPVVMSGAVIGSNIAKYFYLNDRQRVTLVGCGAAGAISAIFNAPLTGMVFALEGVLGEWSIVNFIPIAVASVAGAETSRILQGNEVLFESGTYSIGGFDLVACVGLAAATSFASLLFTRMLRQMHHISGHVPMPLSVRAAFGGMAVGLLAYLVPDVLGEGYHSIDLMIRGVFRDGLMIAAFAGLAKILATGFTLGWGGSGGVFAPSLVIGSFTGIAYHRLILTVFPDTPLVNEGCFALLGIAGLLSGLLQAPLTGMFLALEITGGYEVILPLIIVSALSTTITSHFEPASFYLKDLADRGQILRPGTDQRVLADISISEVLDTDCVKVHPGMLLRELLEVVKTSSRDYFPVEDPKTGKFVGMVHFEYVRPYLFNTIMYDTVFVEQLMDSNPLTVGPDEDLSEVLQMMDLKKLFSVPVVINGRFMGMVSKATLLDRYRNELNVQTSHIY
ncbi:MAG: chloride channel protein [Desulfobacteraceae bacterium]